MPQPLVSVIVPVYNGSATLIKSLQSLLDQTLQGIELIVVNDASTDDTGNILAALAARDSRIIALHNRRNIGVQATRAVAATAATAPWIGFLDADDIARPDMFEKLYHAGERHQVDIVACGAYQTDANSKVLATKIRFRRSQTIKTDIFKRYCQLEFGTGILWNKLFRRAIIIPHISAKFPWRQDINEDLIVNIGCFGDAQSIYLMKDILYEYVRRNGSASSSKTPESAFVATYSAYAIAVGMFKHRGDKFLNEITSLYRVQLSWSAYCLNDTRALSAYEGNITEASKLIAASYPIGLAALAANRIVPRGRVRMLASRLARPARAILK